MSELKEGQKITVDEKTYLMCKVAFAKAKEFTQQEFIGKIFVNVVNVASILKNLDEVVKYQSVCTAYDIFILSNEVPQKGDLVLHKGNILTVAENKGAYLSVYEFSHIDLRTDICEKIVATTDKNSENMYSVGSILKPTTKFLNAFVKQFNSKKQITEVLVELENDKVKIDLADNTIRTKRVVVDTPIETASKILEDVVKYCETHQICEKLNPPDDFYFRAKIWLEKNK